MEIAIAYVEFVIAGVEFSVARVEVMSAECRPPSRSVLTVGGLKISVASGA
jgi:hypothetical protein